MKKDILKKYVQVLAEFFPDGRLHPRVIKYDDKRQYHIDEITECRRIPSQETGHTDVRFTCMIRGGEHFLYYDDHHRWFVNLKQQYA